MDLKKLKTAMGLLNELLARPFVSDEDSNELYKAHRILQNLLVKKETELERDKDLKTFEIDLGGRYQDVIKAKNEQEAYELATIKYPHRANSIQVWEIGGSKRKWTKI